MNLHPNAIDLRDLDTYSRTVAEAWNLGPKYREAVASMHADQVRVNVLLIETFTGEPAVPFYILRDARTRLILAETLDERQARSMVKLNNEMDEDKYWTNACAVITARKAEGKAER